MNLVINARDAMPPVGIEIGDQYVELDQSLRSRTPRRQPANACC